MPRSTLGSVYKKDEMNKLYSENPQTFLPLVTYQTCLLFLSITQKSFDIPECGFFFFFKLLQCVYKNGDKHGAKGGIIAERYYNLATCYGNDWQACVCQGGIH
uniref:Uncharacterized protein n=1 Tax=Cacopsylla melanoneura TaxID=428564 RepID=A0A8D9B4N6_9HEMI